MYVSFCTVCIFLYEIFSIRKQRIWRMSFDFFLFYLFNFRSIWCCNLRLISRVLTILYIHWFIRDDIEFEFSTGIKNPQSKRKRYRNSNIRSFKTFLPIVCKLYKPATDHSETPPEWPTLLLSAFVRKPLRRWFNEKLIIITEKLVEQYSTSVFAAHEDWSRAYI